MINFLKKHTYLITSIVINIILCICLMSNCSQKPQITTEYVEKHDTITLVEERIVEHTKVQYVNTTDTFYVTNNDTVYLYDLPIDYKVYSDTITSDSSETKLDVYYHGFASDIDSIKLNYKYNKEIQTIIQQPKKWGMVVSFGFYGGFGVHGNIQQGTFGYGPEFGVGVQVGIGRMINIK